jgi:hypothetical protein
MVMSHLRVPFSMPRKEKVIVHDYSIFSQVREGV